MNKRPKNISLVAWLNRAISCRGNRVHGLRSRPRRRLDVESLECRDLLTGSAPAANSPPQLTGIEGTAVYYATGDPALPLSKTIAIADTDSTSLNSATIKFATSFYQAGVDVLTFTNTAKLTGTWNSTTGTLTINGSDTVANYQAALRNVKYHTLSGIPWELYRSVIFQVNDGLDNSNDSYRKLLVVLNAPRGDYLYIGDQGASTVKRFDATGQPLGPFVERGSVVGPRGTLFYKANLIVVGQNPGLPINGELDRFDGRTGEAGSPLVPPSDPQAPFAPRGVVIRENIAYVADIGENAPSGRIAKYDATTGTFLGDLVPTGFAAEFRPRGVVFGPDGELYVSVFSIALFGTNDPAGYILRMNPHSGAFQVIAANNGDGEPQPDEIHDLHNPEGLVFGPDGRLYVACLRAHADDTDKILILNYTTQSLVGEIPLDHVGEPRAYAQSLLFGPEGKLFVPITGDGPDTGSVRRYDVRTHTYEVFISSASASDIGGLVQPWYLTFRQTNPATLAYQPWHGFTDSDDVDGSGQVVPQDALVLINELNARKLIDATGKLPLSRPSDSYYYDVNGDGYATTGDVLHVINRLNGKSEEEGESLAAASGPAFTVVDSSAPNWPTSLQLESARAQLMLSERRSTNWREPSACRIDRQLEIAHDTGAQPANNYLPSVSSSVAVPYASCVDEAFTVLDDTQSESDEWWRAAAVLEINGS